jgi:hypothetical protein
MLGTFLFSMEGCVDKPIPLPIDPCFKAKPLSANFKVEEDFDFVVPGWKYYATDTVMSTVVRFTALDSLADKYEWEIGDGTYNQRSFKLYFPFAFLQNKEIVEIKLTVHKKQEKCFPKADSIKTFVKSIYFTTYCKPLYKASFYGYLEEDPTKKFTITIDPCNLYRPDPNNPAITEFAFRIDGFPHSCPSSNYMIGYNFWNSYRQFTFGGNGCFFPGGIGKVQSDKKTLIIDYQSQKCPSPAGKPVPPECVEQVKHRFIGTIVN